MSLIKCPECGATISDKADFCPQCGCKKEFFPIEEETATAVVKEEIATTDENERNREPETPVATDSVEKEPSVNNKDENVGDRKSMHNQSYAIPLCILGVIIFILFACAIISIQETSKKDAVKQEPAVETTSKPTTSVKTQATAKPKAPAKPKKTSKWVYEQKKDEMTGKMNYYAYLQSENYTRFSFPYDNYRIYMRIYVRKHARYGTDVFIEIPEGQFMTDYDGTYISVRFDDGKVKSYLCGEPADMTPTMLFISNPKSFIKKLKSSKECRIGASFYNQGSPTFIFKTEGLKWDH